MYDLLIRNGTIVDGSGMPRYRADVGIEGNKIAAIGKIRANAKMNAVGRADIDDGRRIAIDGVELNGAAAIVGILLIIGRGDRIPDTIEFGIDPEGIGFHEPHNVRIVEILDQERH